MKSKIITILCLISVITVQAQQQWTLEECIEYARNNSTEVQQRQIQIEDRELSLNTAKFSRLPDLSASLGTTANFGRSLSRENTYSDNTRVSGSLGISTSVPIYQGMRIKHQIEGSELNLKASKYDLDGVRENIILNITGLYLNVLFTKELVGVAQYQLTLSVEQYERSKSLYDSGKTPQSTIYESDALVAKDELALVQSNNNLTLALLDLSQAMNHPDTDDFDILSPKYDSILLINMLNPSQIYDRAVENRPFIKAEQVRLESKIREVKIAKSSLYPSVYLRAGYGTNMYHTYMSGAVNESFWAQFKQNSSENIGVSINIPIFNRKASRNSVKSARLSVRSQELYLQDSQRELRKDVEKAYYAAEAAYSKYVSATKAQKSSATAFEYEDKKSQAGRSTIFDFNSAKTDMERAESDLAQAKFEYIFRTKMLEFYVDGKIEL